MWTCPERGQTLPCPRQTPLHSTLGATSNAHQAARLPWPYEEYVPGYAQLAWQLMEKLKVKGARAKAGSNLPLTWSTEEVEAFNILKKALVAGLSLHQLTTGDTYQMRTDASHTAIGDVLEQTKKGEWAPICFFSPFLHFSGQLVSQRKRGLWHRCHPWQVGQLDLIHANQCGH